MINPNGSNIPEARSLLEEIIAGQCGCVDREARDRIQAALDLMRRQKAIRICPTQQRIKITAAVRDQAKLLVKQFPHRSLAEIAMAIPGLGPQASGRLSEIMQGLYDHLK